MGSPYSVETIGLVRTTLRGNHLDDHELKIRVLLTIPDIISKKETKDNSIMKVDSRR